VSLKAFHLLFIAVSVVLAAFVAAWSVNQYQTAHDIGYAVGGALSIAAGIALAVYGTAFQRKMKRL
jgi:hypothetical protein